MTLGRNEQKNPPVTFCYRTLFTFFSTVHRQKDSPFSFFRREVSFCPILTLNSSKWQEYSKVFFLFHFFSLKYLSNVLKPKRHKKAYAEYAHFPGLASKIEYFFLILIINFPDFGNRCQHLFAQILKQDSTKNNVRNTFFFNLIT